MSSPSEHGEYLRVILPKSEACYYSRIVDELPIIQLSAIRTAGVWMSVMDAGAAVTPEHDVLCDAARIDSFLLTRVWLVTNAFSADFPFRAILRCAWADQKDAEIGLIEKALDAANVDEAIELTRALLRDRRLAPAPAALSRVLLRLGPHLERRGLIKLARTSE